jgi:hypothetical protein
MPVPTFADFLSVLDYYGCRKATDLPYDVGEVLAPIAPGVKTPALKLRVESASFRVFEN